MSWHKELPYIRSREMIYRYHEEPCANRFQIRCVHYDSVSEIELACDCTRVFACGCMEGLRCMICDLELDMCSCDPYAYKSTYDYKQTKGQQTEACALSHSIKDEQIKEIWLSARTKSRIERGLATMTWFFSGRNKFCYHENFFSFVLFLSLCLTHRHSHTSIFHVKDRRGRDCWFAIWTCQ